MYERLNPLSRFTYWNRGTWDPKSFDWSCCCLINIPYQLYQDHRTLSKHAMAELYLWLQALAKICVTIRVTEGRHWPMSAQTQSTPTPSQVLTPPPPRGLCGCSCPWWLSRSHGGTGTWHTDNWEEDTSDTLHCATSTQCSRQQPRASEQCLSGSVCEKLWWILKIPVGEAISLDWKQANAARQTNK